MRLARAVVVAAAAVSVVVAAAGGDDPDASPPRGELVLHYVHYKDATALLAPLVARFNRESHRVGGREIRVVRQRGDSGETQAALAAGTDDRTVLWTPASSLWGELLNHAVRVEWVHDDNPPLVHSPQVIAMWEPLARALGWPKPIGWKDVLDLATSSRGWAARGHPEYGAFKLGHTNPFVSTSGLSAVASEYYAVTGKRRGLTLADVGRPEVRAAVRTIEQSIVHYGKTARLLTEQMNRYGQSYVHAVYVQETTVHEWNERRQQKTRLVPIRPADGTFVADYPLIVLDAPWVSREEREAALVFRRWLPRQITAEEAATHGFSRHRPKGLVELEIPPPEVLTAIRTFWEEDRKPANIALVVDTSASMGEATRLDAVQQGLVSFLGELSSKDRVALVTSGESIRTHATLDEPNSRAAARHAIDDLFPSGDEPIYPAVLQALRDVRRLRDATRINAVVVLSDGASVHAPGSDGGLARLLREIEAEPVTEGTSVRIFTVAYGEGADAANLERIATASGGDAFAGSPKDITAVYHEISSYF